MTAHHHDRTRADAGRFGTMYDEGACIATPALELIDRANRDARESRLAGTSGGRGGGHRLRSLLDAPVRLLRSFYSPRT